MSATLTEPPRLLVDPPRGFGRASAAAPPDSSDGGRLTLQQRLDSVWEGLHADGAAECPACGVAMSLTDDRGAARCGGCGSHLS
ncbi:MAG TPA: hypothetical protein VFD31_00500 [Thermoleophilaceae bacterium]|nr:hypothetical protein [Thermoleophilaceae bacterium]